MPLFYQIRDRVRDALVGALLPGDAGRPAQATMLTVDKALVDRAIVTLLLLKGSVRDIHLGLKLLWGATCSTGYISQTLTAAGAQATTCNLNLRLPVPILGEKVKTPLPQAAAQEALAIATFDAWCWLHSEIRQALEPFTPAGSLVAVAKTQATLDAAIGLLKEIGHPEIAAWAADLHPSGYCAC